jgi:hypothetical protein
MNTFEKFRSEKSTAIQMARYYSDTEELTIVFSNANSYTSTKKCLIMYGVGY